MGMFLLGIVILFIGYLTYGHLVENFVRPDQRPTPAITMRDDVDFVPLPLWKNMMIQLLNIAGTGPVIGAIIGIKFGTIAFLIIPIGNIIGGAVHDYVAGMMSLRNGGANLPALIRMTIGERFYRLFLFFMIFLLLLVVAVFINIPANLIDKTFLPQVDFFWIAVLVIFLYYIAATLFPVDKIIGAIYPFFGMLLIIGSAALLVSLIWNGCQTPGLFAESEGFKSVMFTAEKDQPIIPMLFVTIACGILSGFHATQSPIIARTMKSELEARRSFYGMMIVEGVIAMVWAGGALAVYNTVPATLKMGAIGTLSTITTHFLGSWMGTITILSVVVLAVTSGDTAMRSMRLTLAECLHIDQRPLIKRLLLTLPLIVIVAMLLYWSNENTDSFNKLWNYFAWSNQVMAACTLTAVTIWLRAQKKIFWFTLLPGMFITFVVSTYIIWTSPAHGGVVGFGLELDYAYIMAAFLTLSFAVTAYFKGVELRKNKTFDDNGVLLKK